MLTRMATNKLTPARRVRYRLAPTSKKIEARNAAIMDARDRLRTRSAPDRNRGMKRRGEPLRCARKIKPHSHNRHQKKTLIQPTRIQIPQHPKETPYKNAQKKKKHSAPT